MDQLPLLLGHRAALGREDFLINPANAEAVGWIDRWPEWPAPALVLHGPAGCGKSHLAQVFAARSGALVLSAYPGMVLDPVALLSQGTAVVVDDADAGLDERSLLHLFNLCKESHKSVLLTAGDGPTFWKVSLPDLRSRLMSVPTARIGPPDDVVMAAILVKLFSDRQLRVGAEVITYLLRHMERSFDAARRLVADADALSLSERRPVTVPLIKRLFPELRQEGGVDGTDQL